MEEDGPAPRKKTQPSKPRAPKKLKLKEEEVKVEEALIVPDPQVQTWHQELDDLFKHLRDHPQPPEKTLNNTVNVDDQWVCPLHTTCWTRKSSREGGNTPVAK